MIKDKSLVTKSVLCTAFSDLWYEHFCFPGVAGLSATPPHALRARSYNTAEFPSSCTMDSSHHYPSIDMEILSFLHHVWLVSSFPTWGKLFSVSICLSPLLRSVSVTVVSINCVFTKCHNSRMVK